MMIEEFSNLFVNLVVNWNHIIVTKREYFSFQEAGLIG
jgi:DNA repair protein RadC